MLTTKQATEMIRPAWPTVHQRIWHGGRYRNWRLPEPVRINQKLFVEKAALEAWLVKQGLAEWSEL